MRKSRRIQLIVAGIVGAVLFVGGLAWHESGFPLRYLKPERVSLARVTAIRSRRGRDLSAEEVAELCALLRSARRIEDFESRRSAVVELTTVDYGKVMVYEFGNPGANLLVKAGRPEEESCTVHSGKLGVFLARLAEELAAPEPKRGAGEKPTP